MELIRGKDENGEEILYNKLEDEQVMMEWEKPYMEECIRRLEIIGDVLEIGYGLGYSSRKILESEKIRSYTVVESEKEVCEYAEKELDKVRKERPEIEIRVVLGRWEDKLSELGVFDRIFFDDYPYKKYLSLNSYKKEERMSIFVNECISKHMKRGSRLSYYLQNRSTYDYLENVRCELYSYEYNISSECKYKTDDKRMYVPIIIKD